MLWFPVLSLEVEKSRSNTCAQQLLVTADVHAGGTVFIPANTILALQNTGTEPINLIFVFSAPGFEDYMRCTSVPAGQSAPPITLDELRKCSHDGHVVYEDLETAAEKRH